MIKVLIIKIPEGEAPLEIRRAWVGCILPVILPVVGGYTPILPDQLKVTDPRSPEKKLSGFLVNADEAIRILKEKDAAAARWWTARRSSLNVHLLFQYKECERVGAE